MTVFEAIIIAIVEGLTEFLPVSSTGHMIITQELLGIESDNFVKAFTIIIQFGAILSVVVLYWKRFFKLNVVSNKILEQKKGFNRTWKIFITKYDFYVKLFIAFIPAAVVGLLGNSFIDSLLENVEVVAIMLVVGGVFMLFVDKWFRSSDKNQEVSNKIAVKIGLFQCIAMIPGVSRSMATIVGGMASKLTKKNAAEFSFFLAVPTMLAASGYKLLKLVSNPEGVQVLSDNMTTLLVGLAVAFVVALLAIKGFISFLSKYGFKAFGVYRIIIGTIIISLVVAGVKMSII